VGNALQSTNHEFLSIVDWDYDKSVEDKVRPQSLPKKAWATGYNWEVSNNVEIHKLAKAGQWREALHHIKHIRTSGGQVGVYTFSSLLDFFAREGRESEAMALISEMEKSGVPPNVVISNSLLKLYFKQKDLGKALEVWGKMKDTQVRPTCFTYMAIFEGIAGMADAAKAVASRSTLWKELREQATTFVETLQADTKVVKDHKLYGSMLKMLCRLGMLPLAKTVFSDLIGEGSPFTPPPQKQQPPPRTQQSQRPQNRLPPKLTPNLNIYNVLMNGLLAGRDLHSALAMYEVMQRENVAPDSITLNIYMRVLCGLDRVNEAIQFVSASENNTSTSKKQPQPPQRPPGFPDTYSYNTLLKALSDKGRVKECIALFDKMKKGQITITEGGVKRVVEADGISHNIAIDCYARHSNIDRAFDLFMEMRRSGFRRDEPTFGCIIMGLAQVGDAAKALRTVQMMSDVGLKPTRAICECMVKVLKVVGWFEEAEEWQKRRDELAELNAGLKKT